MKTGFLHLSIQLITRLTAPILMLSGCATPPHQQKIDDLISRNFPHTSLNSSEYANQTLINAGVSPQFVLDLEKNYLRSKSHLQRDTIIQMNVLGFLNPGDHSKHFNRNAVKHIRKFIKKYGNTLRKTESEFGVPKEVIASLLWVETRHGKSMGQHHLSGVFYSLVQGSHPDVAKIVFNELPNRKPSSTSNAAKLTTDEIHRKVSDRLLLKSKWAAEQIKAIETLHFNRDQSRKLTEIMNIRSSFAGAFGCSQFIPSSYQKFARSINEPQTPNLFDLKDCIYSVGNYLKQHGWETDNQESHGQSLFEYNRVRDYGEVILRLAEAAKQ